jgi:ADP-ribose pyrophosphatase YjhB (NUDIX family)
MRRAVRAIVVRDGALLVMHRNKFGHEYYTLVGGGVELGEELEQALHRELAEETGLQVANPRLIFVEDAGAPYGDQHIYLCDYVGGEIAMAKDAEEAKLNALGKNLYTPMWLPLEQFASVRFVSPGLKQRLLRGLEHGWPTEPEHFKHIQTVV